MRANGRHFAPEEIRAIKEKIASEPSISRRQLSLWVCEMLDWRSESGKWQEVSCRKALVRLDEEGVIQLPESRKGAFEGKQKRREEVQVREVRCELRGLGEIEISPVSSRYARGSEVWNDLMERYHYLGGGRLCGAQIRYLVSSAEYGWLGGLSFSAATPRMKMRDEWIGWSERARWGHLREVICNSRFLILPTVEVKNLASYVLSRSVKRVGRDWEERYGYRPVLVESFVDPSRYEGTCYEASNWWYVGETSGRRDGVAKKIYVRPVQRAWKRKLCEEPERQLKLRGRGYSAEQWTEEEFGAIEVYDNRLRERVFQVAEDMFRRPGALIPEACNGSYAKARGAYRLFANEKIDMPTVMKPHVEATAGRVTEHKIVLAVQDTTTLNYTTHTATGGMGPINTKGDNGTGLILHDTVAFTPEGLPLGLLDVQCWARDPEEAGKSEKRRDLPIEEKESMKWLNSYRSVSEVQKLCSKTMLISVGDREADIHELFCERATRESGPHLLVRADRGRNRKIEGLTIWEKLVAEPVAGYQEIKVPGKGSRRGRTAKLAVHCAEVTLNSPKGKKLPKVCLWAIYVHEVEYGKDVKEPLDWMLLTTVPTTSFEDACERIRWYTCRWNIEVFHRTLKSACRIEDRRLYDADSLQACLAIDMVISWRIYWLTKQGRETPDVSCEVFLSEHEWQALCAYVKHDVPGEPPCLYDAMLMIGALGGHLGRKNDPPPGTVAMRKGLERLHDIAIAFHLKETLDAPRPP
jgi:hypothetical protein